MVTFGSATWHKVSPLWPFCPPGGLPDRSRRLRVRGSRLGLCSPSLHGGLPLLELFSPSRRSNSATCPSNTAMVSWSPTFPARSRAFSSATATGVAAASGEGAVRGASSVGVMDWLTHMPSPASTAFLQELPGQLRLFLVGSNENHAAIDHQRLPGHEIAV